MLLLLCQALWQTNVIVKVVLDTCCHRLQWFHDVMKKGTMPSETIFRWFMTSVTLRKWVMTSETISKELISWRWDWKGTAFWSGLVIDLAGKWHLADDYVLQTIVKKWSKSRDWYLCLQKQIRCSNFGPFLPKVPLQEICAKFKLP